MLMPFRRVGGESGGCRKPAQQQTSLGAIVICFAMIAVFCLGCRTTKSSEEDFSKPFDAPKVAQLSHDAYKVAWDATFRARYDLRTAAFQPTRLDRETVRYLYAILQKVPWIAQTIEKNPANPRRASRMSYDIVAYDALLLKQRYSPHSFKPETAAQIDKLLQLIDEISDYYQAGNRGSDSQNPSR